MYDIAIICTPPVSASRLAIVQKIAPHCRGILIEKPLCLDLITAYLIDACLSAYGVRYIVGYQYRFHPAILRLRSLVSEKSVDAISELSIVHHTYLPSWHPDTDYSFSLSADISMGGGCLNELSHSIDLALFIMQDRQLVIIDSIISYDTDLALLPGTDSSYVLQMKDRSSPVNARINVDVSLDSRNPIRGVYLSIVTGESFHSNLDSTLFVPEIIRSCQLTPFGRSLQDRLHAMSVNELLLLRQFSYLVESIGYDDLSAFLSCTLHPINETEVVRLIQAARDWSVPC